MKKVNMKKARCPICKRPLRGMKSGRRLKARQRREPMRMPRPYTEQEMAYIWSLLEKRGTTITRLACALGEESGLRAGEMTKLRLADVDLDGRRLSIRRPNVTATENWVPFHDKTDRYLRTWLAERDASVAHDHLLHRPNGRPHNRYTLHNAIASVVCKTVDHRRVNDDGLDSWETHRLRTTMAARLVSYGADAATVAAVGAWKSTNSMDVFAKVEYDVVDRKYREAMARAAEPKS